MSSANVLYMVVCEKCRKPFKLDECQQINLGLTPDEIDNLTHVVYLCEKCESLWVKIFHKWKDNKKIGAEFWQRAWTQFMTGKGECFIFR